MMAEVRILTDAVKLKHPMDKAQLISMSLFLEKYDEENATHLPLSP